MRAIIRICSAAVLVGLAAPVPSQAATCEQTVQQKFNACIEHNRLDTELCRTEAEKALEACPGSYVDVVLKGLVGGTAVLRANNGQIPLGSTISASSNGTYLVLAALARGKAYTVTVSNHPIGQTCTVSNGHGVVGTAKKIIVNVACELADGDVLTYHYDSMRTGWDQTEKTLTPKSVSTGSFGLLQTPVQLDEQIDAQPLIVPNVSMGGAVHDVVYVATENNTVYALDATTGAILNQHSLGAAVQKTMLPTGSYDNGGNCSNNSNNVGVNSTPVIDLSRNSLYAIAYVLVSGTTPNYYIHALNLQTLQEQPGSPKLISPTATLSNGNPYSFQASVQRQRPGLVEVSGTIYAGFGSFCDYAQDKARGWLLGWSADTLLPLSATQLTDQLGAVPSSGQNPDQGCSNWSVSCFLSSIWMSGFGVAADASGNLYFSTGNSNLNSYQPPTNVQESVVKVSSTLQGNPTVFTPNDQHTRDLNDSDLGSGGVLLLPDQPGLVPHLAVVAGKTSGMYLLNRDQLGGLSNQNNTSNLGADVDVNGDCWCGESYFQNASGGLVISSAGSTVGVWTVQTSATTNPKLMPGPTAGLGYTAGNCHDGGFLTTVSSNGAAAPIIWAVGRELSRNCTSVGLYAFDASNTSSLPALLQNPIAAGYWPAPNANPNIVPIVSNGKVYVASYGQLAIFGLGASGTAHILTPTFTPDPNFRQIFGTVVNVDGASVGVRLRSGTVVQADLLQATRKGRTVPIHVGDSIAVLGLSAQGDQVVHAWRSYRVNGDAKAWPVDRIQ
jgi:hypothetical protein